MADFGIAEAAAIGALVVAGASVAIAASASKASLSNQSPGYNAIRIQTSTSGMVIPVVFGTTRTTGNFIWADGFTAVAHPGAAGGGGKGGGSAPASVTYTYAISFMMGLCEGPIAGIGQAWLDKSIYANISDAGIGVILGSYPPSPWGWLLSNYPGVALSYPGVAYVCAVNFDMGNSDSLPNMSFEVQGMNIVPGLQDSNPADIITQMITNSKFGAVPSFPLDTSDYATYCLANNFLLSPAFTDQKALTDHIKDILDHSNSTCIWHDASTLRIVPLGDTSVTGNSTTWNPNVTPLYDLIDDDFLGDNSSDPIKVKRKSPAVAENDIKIEYLDRTNNYNVSVAEAMDQGSIDLYMQRPSSTIKMHGICQTSIASAIAQLVQQRNLYIRNEYDFQLSGMKYGHLEPMDIVTLTDSALGLSKYTVRIVQIEENDNWDLDIVAEDFPLGVGHAATYSRQGGSGLATNFNIDPGNVNAPVIFNAPGALTVTGYEIWCALSGGANWGGCDIYASMDGGSSYKFVTRIYGASRYGVLSAPFASGSDPDTVNICAIDLTVSGGTLLSGTQADADNNITLCMVDNEMISYETATLTALSKYNLATYLRRGCYGSAIAAHLTNANFVRLDSQLAKIPFDSALIGQTMYLKFCSFNTWVSANQSLSDVSPYTYVIGQGLSYPGNVQNFSASQNGVFVIFSWDNINDASVSGYEIRYNLAGDTKWGDGTPITKVEKGTHLVSLKVAPGSWNFMICAIDKSGNYSQAPAEFAMTVANPNFPVITLTDEASLGWPGTLTNLIIHPSGVLVPLSQGPASGDGWNTFNEFCPNPYTTYTYVAGEKLMAQTQRMRALASLISNLGPGASGVASPQLNIKWHAFGASYNSFTPWDVGDITAIAVTMEFIMTASVGLAYISSFIPMLDAPIRTESGAGVSVSALGTAITYSQQFNVLPNAQATAVGASSLIAALTNQTTSGFTVTLYNSAGTAVSGTVNWQSQGV
jgi:hypothetical protein